MDIKPLVLLINRVVTFAILAVLAWLALTRADAFLRLKAVDDCARSSRYESQSESVKTIAPITDVYQQCLKDKGY